MEDIAIEREHFEGLLLLAPTLVRDLQTFANFIREYDIFTL
jgi:hypothetical protein